MGGVELLAPYRSKKRDPAPERSAFLSRLRYRIDTVFSQLTGRYSIKRVWAKDLWHLTGRLLRKVKSRSFCNFLQEGLPFYFSMSITPSVSRSSKRRCSRNSSMSR